MNRDPTKKTMKKKDEDIKGRKIEFGTEKPSGGLT